MHVLLAQKLIDEGYYTLAEKVLFDGINMPKSYGEAKTFFNQEAHIYYLLASIYELSGEKEKALNAYKTASVSKSSVSEISLFRTLSLKKQNLQDEADFVLDEMLSVADNFIVNCDLRSYYGVGSPSPMPFEYNIEKNNLTEGYILKAFALLGKEELIESLKTIEKARELNPYDFRIFTFDKIKNLFN